MDTFTEQLKQLCLSQPTRSKWVFIPTHAIGRTLGERIAREGTNWLNLRFVTPLDIALRIGGPFLIERGITPSEDGIGAALMMRLLLDLPGEGGYFRPLAEHPTMAQALWSTVREIRMTNADPQDLKPDVFSSLEKKNELVSLLSAYQRFLEEEKRGDVTSVYEEAMKHPDWCPIRPEDCWTELPDHVWTRLERDLIDSMSGEKILPWAYKSNDLAVPRRLKAQSTYLIAPDPATNPLAFLMTPALVPKCSFPNGKISLFHAGGHEAEIEEVFRRILDAGAPLDQVEIACASDSNAALVWEKALRHNWPVALGTGIPAELTRPGRALLGFCDWIETDFSAGYFRRLLQSGDLGVDEHVDGFTAGQAARLLARAQAGWGRATYGLALGRLRLDYESRVSDRDASEEDRADAQKKAERTSLVLGWITKVLDSVPTPGDGARIAVQAMVAGALSFMEQTTSKSSAVDHRAATALRESVSELHALGSFSCSLLESLRFIRERVQSLQVAPERPRPGYLSVCRLAQCCYAGRPYLFVVGLEEGRVFPSQTEDAVLLDAERELISADLRLSSDRIDEAVYSTLSRLAGCTASVTFSYSCRDTREFRDTYPSWLMLQAFRLQQGDESLSYHALKASLGEPKSAVPEHREHALSSGAWWLRSTVGSGDQGIEVLNPIFSGVAQGRIADNRRRTGEFTEYDGFVPGAGQALDPCAPGVAISVTELEKAAECPFRFFLKRGLDLRSVDERERDRDMWLDPLTRGAELHDLYAALLRRTRDENRKPSENDGTWLKSLAERRLLELNREMPAATKEVFDRESEDFLADVDLFLQGESTGAHSEPIALEVSFGRSLEETNEESLAQSEPVAISLGDGLTFRIAGRIDRINMVGPGTFEVVDYKTGGFWREKWQGTFDGGRRLQHALYGLAAVELLRGRYQDPKIKGSVYYFSSHKGGLERVTMPAPDQDRIAAVLIDLRNVILGGQFIRTSDDKNCRYCDFIAACGGKANEEAQSKQPDIKLEAYRGLTSHA